MTAAQRASAVQAAAKTYAVRQVAAGRARDELARALFQGVEGGVTPRQLAILSRMSLTQVRALVRRGERLQSGEIDLETATVRDLVDYVQAHGLPITYAGQRRRAELVELIRAAT